MIKKLDADDKTHARIQRVADLVNDLDFALCALADDPDARIMGFVLSPQAYDAVRAIPTAYSHIVPPVPGSDPLTTRPATLLGKTIVPGATERRIPAGAAAPKREYPLP